MADSISNTQDIIDSRDVIERIRELENQSSSWECPDCGNDVTYNVQTEQEERHTEECGLRATGDDLDYGCGLDEDEREELKTLLDLQDQAEGYASDWRYGCTLVHDSYFAEYAQELAEELDYIKRDVTWPYNHIDWDEAADELKVDYTSVEFDGVTYWVR